MFKNDYIMKIIENIIRFLAKVIFNKDYIKYEFPDFDKYEKTDYLYKDILKLLEEAKINEAENLLFENINRYDERYIEMALDFYQRINSLSDEELSKANFSRKEIEEGIRDIAEELEIKIYN